MKAIMILLTLGLASSTFANSLVQIRWTKDNINQATETPNHAVLIRITSPAINGLRGQHTVFSCYSSQATRACNLQALKNIIDTPSVAKANISHHWNCSPYLDPSYRCSRVEVLTLTFANGLKLQSNIYVP